MNFQKIKQQAILRQEQKKSKNNQLNQELDFEKELDIKAQSILDSNTQMVLLLTNTGQLVVYELKKILNRNIEVNDWILESNDISDAKFITPNRIVLIDRAGAINIVQIEEQARKTTVVQKLEFSEKKISGIDFEIVLDLELLCIRNNNSGVTNIYCIDKSGVIVHKQRLKLINIQHLQINCDNLYYIQDEECLIRYNLNEKTKKIMIDQVSQFKINANKILVLQENYLKVADQQGKIEYKIDIEKYMFQNLSGIERSQIGIQRSQSTNYQNKMNNDMNTISKTGCKYKDKYSICICNDKVYLANSNNKFTILGIEVKDLKIQQYRMIGVIFKSMQIVQQDQIYILYLNQQNQLRIEQIMQISSQLSQQSHLDRQQQQLQDQNQVYYQQQQQQIDKNNMEDLISMNSSCESQKDKDKQNDMVLRQDYKPVGQIERQQNNIEKNQNQQFEQINLLDEFQKDEDLKSSSTNRNSQSIRYKYRLVGNKAQKNDDDPIIQLVTEKIVCRLSDLIEDQTRRIEQKFEHRIDQLENKIAQISMRIEMNNEKRQVMDQQKQMFQKDYFQNMIEFNQTLNSAFLSNVNQSIQSKSVQDISQLQIYQKIKQQTNNQKQFQTKLDQLIADLRKQYEQINQCIFSMQLALMSQKQDSKDIDNSQQLITKMAQQKNISNLQSNYQKQKIRQGQDNFINLFQDNNQQQQMDPFYIGSNEQLQQNQVSSQQQQSRFSSIFKRDVEIKYE